MLIVHDFAFQYGGAERTTEALAEAFPEAEVVAIGGDAAVLARMGLADRARTLLPLGRFGRSYRPLSPALPLLVRRLEADVVLSNSYAFAHHARGRTFHLEYCQTPLRQVWVAYDEYRRVLGTPMSLGLRAFRPWLMRADRSAVANVDVIVASCENVRARVRSVYGRDASVLHVPLSPRFFPTGVAREPGLALVVARLVEPYKAVSSVLDAFAALPYRLVVAGDGRDAAAIRARAHANVRFLGALGDDELREWYSRAQVLVFPSEDDFGIVPVEAMACGTPVVALDAGGARETVIHEETGLRFPPGRLTEAVVAAMAREWDHAAIAAHARTFSKERFVASIRSLVGTATAVAER